MQLPGDLTIAICKCSPLPPLISTTTTSQIGWSVHQHRRGPEAQRRHDQDRQNLQSEVHLRHHFA